MSEQWSKADVADTFTKQQVDALLVDLRQEFTERVKNLQRIISKKQNEIDVFRGIARPPRNKEDTR